MSASGTSGGPSSYLELSSNPIEFEPASGTKGTDVFFDDANRQVFILKAAGAMGVVVQGPQSGNSLNFRIEDRGHVSSIKFSPNQNILAVQRSPKSVEFINFVNTEPEKLEYSQSCKGRTTKVIDFQWTGASEIVFITDHGIEFYQVYADRRSLKNLKVIHVAVNWFVWLPEPPVLVLSSGASCSMLHPFVFRSGHVSKLPKFEVDLPISRSQKPTLYQRDVTIVFLYGSVYIAIWRQPVSPLGAPTTVEVALYLVQKDTPARKLHVLHLGMSGPFALHTIDDVVVIHHQPSKRSILFDIKIIDDSDGFVFYHKPVVGSHPIKPFTFSKLVGLGAHQQEVSCDLYSPNWVVFAPNIVIDVTMGYFWYLSLLLDPLVLLIADRVRLVNFLLQRANSKHPLLHVCRLMLGCEEPKQDSATKQDEPVIPSKLAVIAAVFDRINGEYKKLAHDSQGQMQVLDSAPTVELNRLELTSRAVKHTVIDQSDMYTHVFLPFSEQRGVLPKFIISVLVEYIRSMKETEMPVQHFIYKLLITTLVQHGWYYQLHQFLQYHVISDSKPIACLMLSLEGAYPPAYQLALDMLKRLGTADDEIIEVLLSKHQLLPCLRFLHSIGATNSASARKFLDVASLTGDDLVFYAVYKFFETRNIQLRGDPKFLPGEHCEQYVKEFSERFPISGDSQQPTASLQSTSNSSAGMLDFPG